jgi:hypothetical protein
LCICFSCPLSFRNRRICLGFFKVLIWHCFVCRLSDSTVMEDAGIESRTAVTVRRSNPRLELIHPSAGSHITHFTSVLNPQTSKQCCGSGSLCIWASRIRIHYCQIRVRIGILLQSSKNSKKNPDSCCYATSVWLFFYLFEK